jgi:hypothetical protein
MAQGRDGEAAARVANRFGSEANWKNGITQQFLAVSGSMALMRFETVLQQSPMVSIRARRNR